MLSSRSSTPRPRPVHSSSSSLIGYQEEYASSSESPWTTPDKGKEKDDSSTETTFDVRPRKRRRVSSSSVVAKSHLDPKRTALPPTFLDHPSNGSSFNQVSTSDKNIHSYGLCQTCRKCESILLCARCETATCSICARTCTLGAVSTPPTPLLCFSATPSPRATLRQLPGNQTHDTFGEIDVDDLQLRLAISTKASPGNKRRSANALSRESECEDGEGSSRLSECSPSGCSRIVCQACATEDSDSHESTCLDCLDGFGCSLLAAPSPYDS